MINQTKLSIKNLIRALRLPFVTASAFPFIFGTLINSQQLNVLAFLLGLAGVIFMHLSANLINDYCDSKTTADWDDKNFYAFFGGSKLIQEGIFSEKKFLALSIFFGFLSSISIIALAITINSPFIIYALGAILFFGWSYSAKPLQLSYNRLGEIAIFILFGPVPVMGGYFIQTQIFPDLKSFMLSLPFGLLTTAILYANEVPDSLGDEKAGKFTLANKFKKEDAYLIYCILMILAFSFIAINVLCNYINLVSLLAFLAIFYAVKAAGIIKKWPYNKMRLIKSSKLTILTHTIVSLILIISIIII